jgi:hypothetical protein
MTCPLFSHTDNLIKYFREFPIQKSEIYQHFQHFKNKNNKNNNLPSEIYEPENKTFDLLEYINSKTQYDFGDTRKMELKVGYHKDYKTTCLYYDLIHNFNYHLVIIFTPDYLMDHKFQLQIYCTSNSDASISFKSPIHLCEYPTNINGIKLTEDDNDTSHETFIISENEKFIINTLVSDLKFHLLTTMPTKLSDLSKICGHTKEKSTPTSEKMNIENLKNVTLTESQKTIVMSLVLKEANTQLILGKKTIKETDFINSKLNEHEDTTEDDYCDKNSSVLLSFLAKNTILSDLNSGKSVVATALLACPIIVTDNKSITGEDMNYENYYEDVLPLKIVNSSIVVSSYSNIPKWQELINSIYKLPCYFIRNKFDLRRLLNDCLDDNLGNDLSINPHDKIPFSKDFKKRKTINSGVIRLDILNMIPLFVVSETIYRNFYKFVEGIIFQRVIYDHPDQLHARGGWSDNAYETTYYINLFKSYHNIYLTNLLFKYFPNISCSNNILFSPINLLFASLKGFYKTEIDHFNKFNYEYYKKKGSCLFRALNINHIKNDSKIFIKTILKFQEIMSLLMIRTDSDVLSKERPDNKFEIIRMFCQNSHYYSTDFKIIPETVIEKIRQDRIDDAVQFNKFPIRSLEQFNTFFKEKESAKKSEYLTEIEDRINDTSEESNVCTICYEEIDYMLIPHCCYQKFCYKCMVLSMLRGLDSVSDSDACCPMCRYKFDNNDDITFIKNERYEKAISSSNSNNKITMKIDDMIRIAKNHSKSKMLVHVCQHIIEITEKPKIIIVGDCNRMFNYNVKKAGLLDVFKKYNLRLENINSYSKYSKKREALDNFANTDFCDCIVISNYESFMGKNLSFVSDIIFINNAILKNAFNPFVNTLNDSYTEMKQRVWTLREIERLNYNY